jgi:hypothetical protein
MAQSRNQQLAPKALTEPTEPPCPFCENAFWRSNGRGWWACDRLTGRKHICSFAETVVQVPRVAASQAPRRTLTVRLPRRRPRARTAVSLGLAAVVAALAGTWMRASNAR